MLCFIKFPLPKNLWIREGGFQKFLSKKNLSHSAENSRRGESFSVSLILGIEKVWIRRGSIKIFRRRFFVSECRTVSYGKPSVLCLRKFPVPKNYG